MAKRVKETAKPTVKSKRKVGRPKIDLPGNKVETLAEYGLSNTDIANFFGVNETTIRVNFSEFLTKGRAKQKYKLRKKQFEVAMDGNVTMLIWLGKQMLGQSEKLENKTEKRLTIKRSLEFFESDKEN